MAGVLEKIQGSKIDRRRFLQMAAATGVVTAVGLTGCDNKVTTTTPDSPTTASLSGGEWVTVSCP